MSLANQSAQSCMIIWPAKAQSGPVPTGTDVAWTTVSARLAIQLGPQSLVAHLDAVNGSKGGGEGTVSFHLSRVLFPFERTEGERVKEGGIAV